MKLIESVSNTVNVNSTFETTCVSLEDKKNYGIVYTPQFLADYIAQKTITYFLDDFKKTSPSYLKKIRIIDPACGDGQLLYSIWKQLNDHLPLMPQSTLNPMEILSGIDIDEGALMKTMAMIRGISHSTDYFNFKICGTNAIFPFGSNSREEGWALIKKRFDAHKGFDILIANPPWGANINFKETLLRQEYRLYKGQFESADLFIELALSVVKPGGYFAFILPDSLFGAERRELRELLLRHTSIKFIARLGEKIFQNINRACAILICRKKKNPASHKTRCFRLTPDLKSKILLDEIKLNEAENLLAHEVAQQRFIENKDFLFDIDATESEEKLLNKIKANSNSLGNYLISSRGVELSKTGRICKCETCGLWIPLPTAKEPQCSHCKSQIKVASAVIALITSMEKIKDAEPLIVGENIKRYHINPVRWILTDKTGINYKDKALYRGPKIIVRKTGVGISATIDYNGAYTNQVVYIFKLKDKSVKLISLECILAIINSRLMYYYLLKKFGENEWRSHPYITQKQVLDLPLPYINFHDTRQRTIISMITKIITPYIKKNKPLPALLDAKVEYLISKLFKFTKNDYVKIFNTLCTAEPLLPVKALKQISLKDVFSERNIAFINQHGI